ncbi:metal ABC transporter substrate-binding protein [Nocardia zapadnayensis]|uniref:metal ABC transporter substrate-binding protein n=1 Tax=Brevibacterium sp. R8603A2 TaxID=2929779 RepID=UPI001FF9C2E0|nr:MULTISPECIES: metal ABC transporter substrate-binding protein [Actinomycetes]MCK1802127.1 metal ABC transporter substrate-binding protein [Brevibacterium sp. R8603A2]MCX0277639.1 metal ABC transporter substrate-binding protein [Nocardia zapadnayensis]
MRSRRLLPAVLTLPLVTLAACGGGGTSASGSDTPVAVATTSVLGSVLGQITECAGTASSSLMGPGDDPHTFQPSSAQMAELAGAELVVANGLDLEGGLESALANAEQDGATVLEVAPEVDPLPWGAAADDHDGHDHADDAGTDDHGDEEYDHGDEPTSGSGTSGAPADDHDGHDHGTDEHDHAHDEDTAQPGGAVDPHAGHDHGDEDPHFWMDVSRMAAAAHVIGDALAEQTGDDAYGDCGAQIEQELTDTDAEVRELLAGIPEEKRVLITDHEAFGYFADAYDFEIAGVVVPGGSTDAEPSSAELAELTAVIDETGVPVIFSNTAVSTSLVDAVAAEAGTAVEVVELHVGSVGPEDSEAGTYQGMMVENARAVAEALG